MKKRKIPMRKDLLSNQMMPKKELVRIVKNKENVVAIDPTGKAAGRGAYVALVLTTTQMQQLTLRQRLTVMPLQQMMPTTPKPPQMHQIQLIKRL